MFSELVELLREARKAYEELRPLLERRVEEMERLNQNLEEIARRMR